MINRQTHHGCLRRHKDHQAELPATGSARFSMIVAIAGDFRAQMFSTPDSQFATSTPKPGYAACLCTPRQTRDALSDKRMKARRMRTDRNHSRIVGVLYSE